MATMSTDGEYFDVPFLFEELLGDKERWKCQRSGNI